MVGVQSSRDLGFKVLRSSFGVRVWGYWGPCPWRGE